MVLTLERCLLATTECQVGLSLHDSRVGPGKGNQHDDRTGVGVVPLPAPDHRDRGQEDNLIQR